MITLKKELIIGSLLVLFALIFTLYIIGNYKKSLSSLDSKKMLQNPKNQISYLAIDEIEKHNNPADCYLVINNKVYDVTKYINVHEGGQRAIIAFCGKDATEAFVTKGGKGSHSNRAWSDLSKLYIGNVNGKKTSSDNNNYQLGDDTKEKQEYED